jgi:hypothetical protein
MAKYLMHLEVNAYCTDVYIINRNDTFCTYKDQNENWCNIFAKCAFSIIFSLQQQLFIYKFNENEKFA